MVKEVIAKTVLSKHEQGFPTLWDLNPYRGCTIGCKYCFAQYSHKYLGLNDFFTQIIAKKNVAEQLNIELRKKSWQKEQIKLGGISDIYQHSEKKYELLPQIYDVLKKNKTPIFIQTKSTLILRDFEIIKELARYTVVDISTSINTFDENIRKIIEPGAPSSLERMEMLRKFNKICRTTIVSFMPIIPYISDDIKNMDTTFRLTKEFDIDVIVAYPLHLENSNKNGFFELIKSKFPEIFPEFKTLYKNSNVDADYSEKLFQKISFLRSKYQLFNSYSPVSKPKQDIQLSLFY